MSLKAILDAIRAEGEAQVRAIETGAMQKREALMETAREEANEVWAKEHTAAVAPAHRERAKLLHRARLEEMQGIGSAREELVDSALAQTRGRLASARGDPAYADILRRLIKEAARELESFRSSDVPDAAVLEADPRDKALLTRILREEGLVFEVCLDLESWGGVIARSADARIAVINTLETRLEQAVPYLRRYLAALFEIEPSVEPAVLEV